MTNKTIRTSRERKIVPKTLGEESLAQFYKSLKEAGLPSPENQLKDGDEKKRIDALWLFVDQMNDVLFKATGARLHFVFYQDEWLEAIEKGMRSVKPQKNNNDGISKTTKNKHGKS